MKVNYWVIMVDYYMWDEEKGEMYTSPCYLYVTRDKHKIYIFDEKPNREHLDLKWFETENDAWDYINSRDSFKNSCSFENVRPVHIIEN